MIYEGKQQIFSQNEQSSLIRLINTEDESSTKKHEEGKTSFSLRLAKYLTTSGLGDILDITNIVLSFGMAVLQCIETYYWREGTYAIPSPIKTILILELTFNLYFILDFAINFYISENRLFFAFQTTSIIEYVSILPSLLVRLGAIDGKKEIMMTRIFRFLLCFKLDKILQRHSFEVTRLAFKPLCTVVSIIIINSTFLIVVEQRESMHDYVYFMVVTMTSLGFGDVVPTTISGRFSIIATLLIMFLTLPAQIQDLTRALNLHSPFARMTYQTSKDFDHVLLLGSSQVEGFQTFLTELYHSDHGLNDITSLILQPNQPPEEMQILLKQPYLQSKVFYLEGHPLKNKDLARAGAQECKCVIVLANKTSSNPKRDDYKNIVHAYAVKQYVRRYRRRGVRVCLQVLQPCSKDLYFNSLGGEEVDQVICVDELKLYLLSKTCLCPGINTLISFLIQSTKPNYDRDKYNKESNNWIDDYLYGMQNEIYRVPLEPENFVGLTFAQISQHIYRQFGSILFALEVTLSGETRVFVNPAEYLFEDYLHFGYVIATNMPDIEEIQKIIFPDYVTRNYNFPNIVPRGIQKKTQIQIETDKMKETISQSVDNEYSRHQPYYQVKPNSLQLGLKTIGNEKYENHYIVCGVVRDMKYLMMPLRARSLKTIHPIIILSPDPIPTEIQVQINKFPKVYYLQGSPLKLNDLERACITKANALVILQKPQDQEENIASMVDADTIFIYKTVKLLNPSINIITELASISTISFLQLSRNNYVQKYGWVVSEPFASGEIYVSTMLDTLICQSYYNPFITRNATLNRKAKQTYQSMKLQQSNLFLIAIPTKYQEKTFGELYDALVLDQKMIPIGLYRGERVKDNNKPYVFLKPPSDVKLSIRDKAFVLSAKQPRESESNQHDYQQHNLFTFKSKLQGEEGKIDLEYAKELWKIKNRMNNYKDQLASLNQEIFNQGLIKEGQLLKIDFFLDFIPRIRNNIREQLSKLNVQ